MKSAEGRYAAGIIVMYVYSHSAHRTLGVVCGQTVSFTGFHAKKNDAEALRRVKLPRYRGMCTGFLTNDFSLPALTVTELHIGVLADRIVLQLDQAAFSNQGLVRHHRQRRKDTGLIAASVYLLVAIAITKNRLIIAQPRYTILQILSASGFETMPLLQVSQKGHRTI